MTEEKRTKCFSGWLMLAVGLALVIVAVWWQVAIIISMIQQETWQWIILGSVVLLAVGVTVLCGLFVLQPRQAGAIVLFGEYKGSELRNGFMWRNPFAAVRKISLRSRNLNGEKLKVNDLAGNPIEIAAVVVWRVSQTAQALFDVDDYEEYVETQSEAAVRRLAGRYPYDGGDDEISLRGGTDEVNHHLMEELQERLGKAGVEVEEARISHLAY